MDIETTNGSLNRKLRMALVGGGQGAFIGRVHATAAVLDNRAELVAGALSSSPERAKASAPAYDIDDSRAYGSVSELIEKELALPEDQRIDFEDGYGFRSEEFPFPQPRGPQLPLYIRGLSYFIIKRHLNL